ncbi:hypothetical protein MITS9504_02527 [Synechococcus sp. MIT S9504]|nr:hypothetical protein MITS9504_02527 [Synechococcus sp. MIT S9504]
MILWLITVTRFWIEIMPFPEELGMLLSLVSFFGGFFILPLIAHYTGFLDK